MDPVFADHQIAVAQLQIIQGGWVVQKLETGEAGFAELNGELANMSAVVLLSSRVILYYKSTV